MCLNESKLGQLQNENLRIKEKLFQDHISIYALLPNLTNNVGEILIKDHISIYALIPNLTNNAGEILIKNEEDSQECNKQSLPRIMR